MGRWLQEKRLRTEMKSERDVNKEEKKIHRMINF